MQEMNKLYQLIQRIEPDYAYLSEDDQKLFWNYKLAAETGGELPKTAPENIVRMYNFLHKEPTPFEAVVDPNSVVEKIASGVEPVLSMAQVVKDLLGAKAMLNNNEAVFLSAVTQKLAKRIHLSEDETRVLLEIYRRKGF